MIEPGRTESVREMLELEKMAKEKLISKDRFARDDERERELGGIVQRKSLEACVDVELVYETTGRRNRRTGESTFVLGFLRRHLVLLPGLRQSLSQRITIRRR